MDIIFWTGIFSETEPYRPIGAYQLAHWMRSNGYECQVIDFIQTMSADELYGFTKKFISSNTLCIGVSSTFWSVRDPDDKHQRWTPGGIPPVVKETIDLIKANHPDIKLVLGGSQADNKPQHFYNLFDAIVVGYGEEMFLDLIDSWRKDKKLLVPTMQGNVPYLTSSPNKRFDIMCSDHRFIRQDCIVPGETLPLEIGRGCIFSCKFCSYLNIGKTKNDYVRNMDFLQQEILHNKEQFGTTNYILLDDTFNDSNEKVRAWGGMLNELPFGVNYTGYMRADLLSRFPEQIDIFKDTGLVAAHFGVETFNPEASMLIGKGWNGKEGKDFFIRLRNTWADKTLFMMSLIVGIPPETEEDCIATNEWLIENNMPSWVWHPLRINTSSRTNKSEFEKNYQKYGFVPTVSGGWIAKHGNNYIQARKLAGRLMEDDRRARSNLSNWQMLSFMTLGYTREEITKVKISEFDYSEKDRRFNEFVVQYKKLLTEL